MVNWGTQSAVWVSNDYRLGQLGTIVSIVTRTLAEWIEGKYFIDNIAQTFPTLIIVIAGLEEDLVPTQRNIRDQNGEIIFFSSPNTFVTLRMEFETPSYSHDTICCNVLARFPVVSSNYLFLFSIQFSRFSFSLFSSHFKAVTKTGLITEWCAPHVQIRHYI